MRLRESLTEARGLVKLARDGSLRTLLRDTLLSDPLYNLERSRLRTIPSSPRIPIVNLRALIEQPRDVEVREFAYYDGSMPIIDLCALLALAAAWQPKRILEIGTSLGMTTLNMAYTVPEAHLVTIDISDRLEQSETRVFLPCGANAVIRNSRYIGERFKADQRVLNRIDLIVTDSTRWKPHGEFDFILIDAAHDYASVRSDSETALEALGPEGVIVWDDYERSPGVGDVPRVLHELATRLPLRNIGGTRLVIYQKHAAARAYPRAPTSQAQQAKST